MGTEVPDTRARAHRRVEEWDLVSRVAAGSEPATAELIRRYRPVLATYQRALTGSATGDGDVVDEVLHNVVTHLIRGGKAPDDLTAYLFAALRNRIARLGKEQRAFRRELELLERSGDGVAIPGLSQGLLFAAGILPVEAGRGAPSVLQRLAGALELGLSEEERLIAGWYAAGVAHSEIGEWLGISRDAAKKRVQRISRRLVLRACREARAWRDEDRRALDRSFPGMLDECARRLKATGTRQTKEEA